MSRVPPTVPLPLAAAGLLLAALAGPAASAECPQLGPLNAQALTLYRQAELVQAKQAIDQGYAALACQERAVATADLLELYRLDALVAMSNADTKTLVFATLRAVAAQHDGGRPPDVYGPELQAQYDTWAARLAEDLVTVRVVDEGVAWIDGRRVDALHPLEVVAGEHLLQLPASPETPDTVRSEVREIAGDTALLTGIGQVVPVPPPDPVPAPVPIEPVPVLPDPAVPDPVPEPAPQPRRRRPVALTVAGAVAGVLTGATLGTALFSERQFHASPYLADDFYGCPRGAGCYPAARARAIRVDARRIDIAYGLGYGLSAVTGGLTLVTVVGLPARR